MRKITGAQLLADRRGMSLVQVVIAGAIMSVLGMAMMTIMSNNQQAQRTAMLREDAGNTATLVGMLLRDRKICRESFLKTGPLEKKQLNQGIKIAELKAPGAKDPLIVSGRSLKKMTLEPIQGRRDLAGASDERYMAQLRLEFEQGGASFGGGVTARTIPLAFAMAGGAAFDCSSDLEEDPGDSNPHFNKNNCHGQYYPARNDHLTKVVKQAGEKGFPLGPYTIGDFFAFHQGNENYRPVGDKERRALVEASPPPLLEVKKTDLLLPGPKPPTSPLIDGPERVYYRKVAGAEYLVTPTASNGYAMKSMNGQNIVVTHDAEQGAQTKVEPAPKVEAVCVGGQWVKF